MKKKIIAVLLTCHNRKNKTVACLESLHQASIPAEYEIEIFLTDDGSTDGTSEVVQNLYPAIYIVKGNGSLYWAGGMRLAWETALNKNHYDAYLLLNDDVVLHSDFFLKLLEADVYAFAKTGKKGIYSGATYDEKNGKVTYGGSKIINYLLKVKLQMVIPNGRPNECDVTNANVLWVSKEVVDEIGIFDKRFTHSMADYDYSLQAVRKKLPVLLASDVCGVCIDDHGRNWRSSNYSLKERVAYLKSPKGLAMNEYLYYVGKHFPLFFPYSFIMLWLKTLFPIIWDKVKY